MTRNTRFRSQPRGMFSVFKWIIFLFILFIIAGVVFLSVKFNQPFNHLGSEQVFTVTAGSSTGTIANKLEEEGVIDDALWFRVYTYFKGSSNKIQAGEYALSSAMPIREINRKLVAGETIDDSVSLTVIEGWNIRDIASAVETLGVMRSADFREAAGFPDGGAIAEFASEYGFLKLAPGNMSLEGFLFPDTYFIDKEAKPEDVMVRLLNNFDRKVWAELGDELQNRDLSFYEILTLASVVEREVGRNVVKGTKLSEQELADLQQERKIVAGIFMNRLEAGMLLESDATVAYITGRKENRATLADLAIDSPYNTYKYQGLPPGPISSPSFESIEATLNPEPSDYFYFLTDPAGKAYYARTFEEHQQNRINYLQ